MLSRVADSLYWMSRYMERSDGILRILKVNYASSQEDMHDFSWKPVLRLCTYLDEESIKPLVRSTRSVLQYIVVNKDNSNSIINIITQARENARSGQDHITKELWQCLNDFYHMVKDERLNEWLQKEDPITILDTLTRQCVLYYGMADITMSRGEGYSFMNIGKFLERTLRSADILDIKFGSREYKSNYGPDAAYLKHLLLSIAGLELYLKTYRSGFESRNVLEQIALNNNFPHSIIYSINRLSRYFERLKSEKNAEAFNRLNFMIGKIQSQVMYSTVESIIQEGLPSFLGSIKEDLYKVANTLNQHYFGYS